MPFQTFWANQFTLVFLIMDSHFFILPQWKHASSSVNNRRGLKNLVLSSWGDESTLSEGYVNPHYTSDYYKIYSEKTNQNLVSSILWSRPYILQPSVWNCFGSDWRFLFDNTETLEWRCDWFWPFRRLDMLYWWKLPSRRCSSFSSCKS